MSDETRSCKDCGAAFDRWQNWRGNPGAAGCRCKSCYLAYTRRRQTPNPKFDGMAKANRTDAEYEASLAHLPTDQKMKRLYSSKRWHRLRGRVFEEESRCGFCGGPVDKSLSGHDRMGPTGDHILPVDLGGEFFDRSNVQLAHRTCNSKAGRKLQDVRLTTYSRAGEWIGSRLLARAS